MFNKETEYALRGLVYIQMRNLRGGRPGTNEIAREIEAPRFFTAKILQRLVRLGFLMSMKGKGGGFYFDKDKPELTIKEIINATGGNRVISSCGFGLKNCCADEPCPLHEQYAPIKKAIDRLVSVETIQSLEKKYTMSSKSI